MRVFGLIGYPLSHSFSKKYFDEKFEKEGLTDCRFENFPIKSIDDLKHVILPNNPDLQGIAVTIPFKQLVLRHLSTTEAIPDKIKACNCIRIVNGKLVGYNTDYIGFEKSIGPILQNHHKKALILGNGGVTASAEYVLERIGIKTTIVSRKIHDGSVMTYNDIDANVIADHTLIINTTPLGMYPDIDTAPDIPYECITQKHLFFDMVYNPEKTVFLKRGEQKGASIKNGYEMLVLQAEENWRIWNQ